MRKKTVSELNGLAICSGINPMKGLGKKKRKKRDEIIPKKHKEDWKRVFIFS